MNVHQHRAFTAADKGWRVLLVPATHTLILHDGYAAWLHRWPSEIGGPQEFIHFLQNAEPHYIVRKLFLGSDRPKKEFDAHRTRRELRRAMADHWRHMKRDPRVWGSLYAHAISLIGEITTLEDLHEIAGDLDGLVGDSLDAYVQERPSDAFETLLHDAVPVLKTALPLILSEYLYGSR